MDNMAHALHDGKVRLQTPSEYVIRITFPLQQWLHESASVLRIRTLRVLFQYELTCLLRHLLAMQDDDTIAVKVLARSPSHWSKCGTEWCCVERPRQMEVKCRRCNHKRVHSFMQQMVVSLP